MFKRDNRHNKIAMPIASREWGVCFCALFTLVFTGWSLGGYNDWALHILLFGGISTFIFSVGPLPNAWNGYDQNHGNLKNLRRLLNLPIFWLSFSFLFYILLQYINPSISQIIGEESWWVKSMKAPLGKDMPSSVQSNYYEMNALRALVIHAAAFTCGLGIVVGIQRRKTALLLIWAFICSGVLMGFIAILHKFSGSEYLLWIFECVNTKHWGSFYYRNQGAAFLMLVAIICGVLYFYYLNRSQERRNKGGPHFLCFFFAFLLYGSIWLALSRGAIILGSLLLLIFISASAFQHAKSCLKEGSIFITILLCFLALVGVSFFIQFFDWEKITNRAEHFAEVFNHIESYDRTLSTRATWDMAQDRIIYGWGGGSFRYIFPIYQKKYDKIWYSYHHKKKGWMGRDVYHYAHNDWAQFLAEYGLVGCSFLIALFLIVTAGFLRIFKTSILAGVIYISGVLLIFIHNFVDFIFSSPSYWVAFWGSLLLLAKLFYLEQKAETRASI